MHGIATAAGCRLVSMCDLAVAADTAKFALPGVNRPGCGIGRLPEPIFYGPKIRLESPQPYQYSLPAAEAFPAL